MSGLETYLVDQQKSSFNTFDSPVFDISNACTRMGLLNEVEGRGKSMFLTDYRY